MKCGWSNRPRKATASPTRVQPRDDISSLEIQQILAQATEEAVNNMKPRRQQTAEAGQQAASPQNPLEDPVDPIDSLLNQDSK